MSLIRLTDVEKEVIRRAMVATFENFTFDFGARLGIEPERMQDLLDLWPNIDDSRDDSNTCFAINNSLNDFLHGLGISDEQALETMGVNRAELGRIYKKWAAERGWDYTGVI